MKTIRGVTDELRKHIIQERLSGSSYSSLQRKYNLKTAGVIQYWMRTFGIMENKTQPVSVSVTEETEDPLLLRKQLKEANSRADKAELRAKALETIIEIAEEKFKIPIRKKHGTRQL